jgi:hypothetical protein
MPRSFQSIQFRDISFSMKCNSCGDGLNFHVCLYAISKAGYFYTSAPMYKTVKKNKIHRIYHLHRFSVPKIIIKVNWGFNIVYAWERYIYVWMYLIDSFRILETV